MKLSDKQLVVAQYLNGKGEVKKAKIMEDLHVDYWYYLNASKHFGEILSRMVKGGILRRVKPGVYTLVSLNKTKQNEDPNQLKLIQ